MIVHHFVHRINMFQILLYPKSTIIKSNLKKENEIETDFYSKDDGFYFDIDFTLFESTNINLKTLSNSKSIKINIKEGFQYIKTININPNNQINLPDLLHFNKHPIYLQKKGQF